MNKINKTPDWEGMFRTIAKQAPTFASVEAQKFFKRSFTNQGFTDRALVKWDERKNDTRPGGAVLTSTGNLRDSIEIAKVSNKQVVLVNGSPYAKIHNEGGRIRVVQYIRPHTRNNLFGREIRAQIQAHSRKVDFTMPKRQFMGHSETLANNFDSWMANEIAKAVQKIKP
ncbi:MAG: phage virion morphogenesis protein [Vicingaceae bacterium]|nr:phage virion morphogenesis protein [Vicingaceae bacterium]